MICGFVQKRPPRRATLASLLILYNVTFTMSCSKRLRSRPSQIQTLRGSFAFAAHSLEGSVVPSSASPPPSVSRVSSPLVSSSGSPLGFVRFTFGNFVVFHIIRHVRVSVAFRLSLPHPSHELRGTCLPTFGKKRTRWWRAQQRSSRLYARRRGIMVRVIRLKSPPPSQTICRDKWQVAPAGSASHAGGSCRRVGGTPVATRFLPLPS
jgi:hypothetical protein